MSRKTKLTPELQEKVVEYLESGVTVENIVAAVGIAKSTFYDWIKRGEESDRKTIYSDFSDAVTRAQKQSLIRAEQVAREGLEEREELITAIEEVVETRLRGVHKLDENGKSYVEKVPYEYRRIVTRTTTRTILPNPDYAIKYLSRLDPATWAETRKMEIAGEGGGPIQTTQTNVNLEAENAHDAASILKQLAELGAIPPEPSPSDNNATTQ